MYERARDGASGFKALGCPPIESPCAHVPPANVQDNDSGDAATFRADRIVNPERKGITGALRYA